jgi:hypothetical protein
MCDTKLRSAISLMQLAVDPIYQDSILLALELHLRLVRRATSAQKEALHKCRAHQATWAWVLTQNQKMTWLAARQGTTVTKRRPKRRRHMPTAALQVIIAQQRFFLQRRTPVLKARTHNQQQARWHRLAAAKDALLVCTVLPGAQLLELLGHKFAQSTLGVKLATILQGIAQQESR